MGRASRQEAARTRERIVEKASELFRASGVDHVSIADVVDQLDLTKGGFYKHFSSKDELVAEAFGVAFQHACSTWRSVRERSEAAAIPATKGLVHHYLRHGGNNQRCPMIAFAPHVSGGHATDQTCDAFKSGIRDLLEQFGVREASSHGQAASTDVLVLFAAMIGVRVLGEAAGDTQSVEDIRKAILTVANTLPKSTDA